MNSVISVKKIECIDAFFLIDIVCSKIISRLYKAKVIPDYLTQTHTLRNETANKKSIHYVAAGDGESRAAATSCRFRCCGDKLWRCLRYYAGDEVVKGWFYECLRFPSARRFLSFRDAFRRKQHILNKCNINIFNWGFYLC